MTNDKQRVDFPDSGENVRRTKGARPGQGRLVELMRALNEAPEVACSRYHTDEDCKGCQFDKDDRCDVAGREADYLLTNGVIVPPVKYGDSLYIITEVSKTIVETIVIGVWIYEESFTVLTIHGNILNDSFGKTVFPTREEAEQALVNYGSSKNDVVRKEDEGK